MSITDHENQQLNQVVDQSIAENGYGSIVTFSETGISIFVSIGFTEKDFPEFMFSLGIQAPLAANLNKLVGDNWKALSTSAKTNHAIPADLASFVGTRCFKLVEVDPKYLGPLVEYHNARYREGYRIMNLVFSDHNGRYPGEPEFNAQFSQCVYPSRYLH